MSKKTKSNNGAIVKLVIWAVVLAILVVIFNIAMVFNNDFFNGVSFSGGFSVISGYTYENANMYSAGGKSYSDEVKSLDIEWTAGEVKIVAYDGDEIKIEESGAGEKDENRVRSYLSDGRLHIRYAKSGIRFFGSMPTKNLTVYIPEKYATALDKIDITAVSANVLTQGKLVCREIDVEAVSGKIILSDIKAEDAEFKTVSGDISIIGEVSRLDVDGVSAILEITLKTTPRSLKTETVSGNVEITLLDSEAGFRAELESVSGDMKLGGENVGTVYKHKDGGASFSFESISGSVKIEFKDK